MDPVGPWSAYASYNRLAGVQASATSGDLHHSLSSSTASVVPPTTASQLLPSGFLSAAPVGYDGVFSPLFHHANSKPPHYMTQHRQAISQSSTKVEPEYPQAQNFFEQNSNWQQNSPFGILPHESVVTTTASKSYDSFNQHFPVQSVNQLSSKNASVNRAHSPQVAATTTAKTQPSSFFPVAPTFTEAGASSTKPYMSPSASSIQQSCIVTSSITNNGTSKDYHLTQNPAHPVYVSSTPESSLIEKPFSSPKPSLQTKAQAKIYPEVAGQTERQRNDEQSQNSPVSYSLMDPNRLNYTASNSNNKRGITPNYRHYQNANAETDFQRGKDFPNNNSADCSVVVPRRPSPLQAHSQASPIGHAPSPAYPLYNSPMNTTLSSPQNSNQVTPPSPMDVSVTRPNSQNNPYPSVITRVLNSDKNYAERFERNNQNQTSWNERRKFNNFNIAGSSLDIASRQIDVSSRSDAVSRQLMPGLSDRQAYFDSSDVPLQDLSSCRGDPMSLVKNLQQSCQVQPEIKEEIKTEKRRKSNESLSDMSGRIPPPAHSSALNPQSQNGVYFEFDRWNLPPPSSSKIYAAQAMQQHQNLMVPHPHSHHPPPPLPYFPPFHLPPHHPSEYQSVDMASISSYNDQNASQSVAYHHVQEEQPKVVVPNIEEELNFLSETNLSRPAQVQSLNPSHMPKFMEKSVGQVGFMSSYLKFLQGEKDSSPPPAYRLGRKHSWRTKPMNEISLENNGINLQGTSLNYPIQRLSQGDPQDDPRYFPLPKERKENNFNSSDDGLSSDEDMFNKKSMMSMVNKEPPVVEKKRKKGRPLKPGGPTEMRRLKQKLKEAARSETKSEVENIPRRETSKRLAKEKISLQAFSKADDEFEEPQEFADSDSDPVWTPAVKLDAVDDAPVKKGKRGRPRKNVVKNLLGDGLSNFKSQDIHGSLGLSALTATGKQDSNPALLNNLQAFTGQQVNLKGLTHEENQFKVGEFLVLKSNLQELWPPIWRVDGKNVIQKFEPFEDNGVTLYKNIPALYNSWTMEANSQYITVPVKIRSQNPTEVVIEFLKNKLVVVDPTFVSNSMQESTSYQDNFEVYIQTLISQALDSNFLTEIFQENDDYFLSNVKIIDDVTSSKRQKLIDNLNWPPSVQIAVTTWPCFMMNEITNSYLDKNCAACDCAGVSARVLMYGQPYSVSTLEGCQPDPKAVNEKDFIMCRICANRVELFSKVAHQKYLMYLECAKRVAEKRTSDPRKDTTCILNELLADERWLNQLFYGVRSNWADVDSIEHSLKLVI